MKTIKDLANVREYKMYTFLPKEIASKHNQVVYAKQEKCRVDISKAVQTINSLCDISEKSKENSKEKNQRPPDVVAQLANSITSIKEKGCVTCGKENIFVKQQGDRHMCIDCRDLLKTADNDPVFVFLDEEGVIQSIGVRNDTLRNEKIYYSVPNEELQFQNQRCYATYADENELIVLLHDEKKE